ncbi:MAG: ABC transporter ATP-binding protein [Candidatus Margulisiibacteriota bacterium]|jgi:ABC-2 type transport system ATP-binding protein
MKQKAVVVQDLTKKFGSFIAVNKLNFEVNKGEIFGFLGANGAGKTTTIRMLSGLLTPTSGFAQVAGFDLAQQVNKIKESIGYMSQKFSLYLDLTVKENIQFYGGIYGLSRKKIQVQITELVSYMHLEEFVNKLAKELPLGFKQKLALSISLLHDPAIVFLDEPTSGVDPISRRDFWLLIHKLANQGKTIFVTTHNMDEAEYCHKICIMKDGVIVALDTPINLKNTYQENSMQAVFIKIVNRAA